MSYFYVITGGTFVDVAPHFSLAAPAFGKVGGLLMKYLAGRIWDEADISVVSVRTRMALGSDGLRIGVEEEAVIAAGLKDLRTNDDMAALVAYLVSRPDTRGIVMAAAICDFEPIVRSERRLDTSQGLQTFMLKPTAKILSTIRRERKDIFLVGFKATAGDDPDHQYLRGLQLLKKNSCNLVLANDIKTRLNMVITPEQARHYEGTDREASIEGLADMIIDRVDSHFTRTTVVPGDAISWTAPEVPESLRKVVDHCIARGAYKPFLGSTVGHFAVKVDDKTILTSKRKTDFNRLPEIGLVKLVTTGPNEMLAYGAKPSVGGQSQRIIFKEHPDVDCIVHAHVPLRPSAVASVPIRPQAPFECGSHECGQNTSDGLATFGGRIKAVMLDKHGPNIVFNRNVDPQEVIDFIELHFDLAGRTDDVSPEAAREFA